MSFSKLPPWCLYILVPLAIYGLFLQVWRKNRSDKKRVADEPTSPIDYEELGRAERIAAAEPSLFEQYSQNLISIGKFTTFHFNEADMERLVDELRANGIESRHLFSETMPTGVITALGPAGYFQIWVEPQDEERTRAFLKNKYKKEF